MFADRVFAAIEKSHSFICAGFDPILDNLPKYLTAALSSSEKSNDDTICQVLCRLCDLSVSAIVGHVAAIKPNLAYFEQYGIAGLRAFSHLRDRAWSNSIPVIADAKRGDIGSTAEAYARAFLGSERGALIADALTVNPFMGFDTLQPFVAACIRNGKGLFVLVRTSNPGSAEIQLTKDKSGRSSSEMVADWVEQQSATLTGKCGWSSLGAVVGATYPQELAMLRSRMPHAQLLIPGMGAQGGSADDAAKGFVKNNSGKIGGAVVNVSRGLFGNIPADITSDDAFVRLIQDRLRGFNEALNKSLAGLTN